MDDVGPLHGGVDNLQGFLSPEFGEVEVMLVHQRLEYRHVEVPQGEKVLVVLAGVVGRQDAYFVPAFPQLRSKTLCRDARSVIIGIIRVYDKKNLHTLLL